MQLEDFKHDEAHTPNGMKIEGVYENQRNAKNADLYRDMIKVAYGADQCIVAHHITYVAVDKVDGYDMQVVEEIPSADTLLFDVDVAKKLWGPRWPEVLMTLSCLTIERRDDVVRKLWAIRTDKGIPFDVNIVSL